MENITEKLQALLSDEESLKQLQSLCELLSDSKPKDGTGKSSAENISADESSENTECRYTDEDDGQDMGFDFSTIFKLQSLFGAGDKENKNTVLLNALKPHLAPERQERVDKAVKIMNLLEAASVLKESGLLNEII